MAVLTAPQPKHIEIGQTVAAAAQAEAGYVVYKKPINNRGPRKAGNAKPKYEPPVVKAGEGHSDLIGRQYKLLTKEEFTKNFQWRKENKVCTECGSSAHKYRKCAVREAKIRKTVASKEINFHMKEPVFQASRNRFLILPRELRDMILQWVVGEYREAGDDDATFTIQTDRKFLPSVFKVSKQISRESLGVLVRTNNFIIRSGRAMKFFKRFIKDHKIQDFVRSLEFLSFHWFNPGQAYPASRHGPGGVYSMVSGDVVLMQVCTKLHRVRISLDVCHTILAGDPIAYSVQDFINRYNLDQVINCHHLIELVLELTDRHGYAHGLQPGQDVWSNGEDLAQMIRDRIADRVEMEVTAEFEAKEEAAAEKAVVEQREHKVDEVQAQAALVRAIAAAQTTSVRTVHITRIRR